MSVPAVSIASLAVVISCLCPPVFATRAIEPNGGSAVTAALSDRVLWAEGSVFQATTLPNGGDHNLGWSAKSPLSLAAKIKCNGKGVQSCYAWVDLPIGPDRRDFLDFDFLFHLPRDVIHHDDSIRAPVVGRCDRPETLLPRGIPLNT